MDPVASNLLFQHLTFLNYSFECLPRCVAKLSLPSHILIVIRDCYDTDV
jgi:hypothetical protein